MKKHEQHILKLNERAKELRCLYKVEVILKDYRSDTLDVFKKITEEIPFGWQYPMNCKAKITFGNKCVYTEGYKETEWIQKSDIILNNEVAGDLSIVYVQPVDHFNVDPFLAEEEHLLYAITDRLSNYIFNKQFKEAFVEWDRTVNILKMLKDKEARAFRILMNTDPDEAMEYFKSPSKEITSSQELETILSNKSQKHWKWRMSMAEKIAGQIDRERFGIKSLYLFGSTVKANSGPQSDIDLIIHYNGNEEKRQNFELWAEGWSLALAELNKLKTGFSTKVLLDLHFITDEDIEKKTTFAAMIDKDFDIRKLI